VAPSPGEVSVAPSPGEVSVAPSPGEVSEAPSPGEVSVAPSPEPVVRRRRRNESPRPNRKRVITEADGFRRAPLPAVPTYVPPPPPPPFRRRRQAESPTPSRKRVITEANGFRRAPLPAVPTYVPPPPPPSALPPHLRGRAVGPRPPPIGLSAQGARNLQRQGGTRRKGGRRGRRTTRKH
jgi:hypothetical protein